MRNLISYFSNQPAVLTPSLKIKPQILVVGDKTWQQIVREESAQCRLSPSDAELLEYDLATAIEAGQTVTCFKARRLIVDMCYNIVRYSR